jgi:ParB family chromosome partitioning protein
MEKKISASQGRGLLALKSQKDQLEMLASMLGQKITVRDLEERARQQGPTGRKDANILYFEEKLREFLGTKVSISHKKDKGKITIDYYSKDEFKEIVEKILEDE